MSRRRLLLAALAVLALLRLRHLGASITGDEAYMARNYAVNEARYIVTHYEVPNNHILLSLILHAVDAASPKKLLASLAHPAPLQLVSALSSAACLPLLFDLGLMLLGPAGAALSVAVLGLSYWHLLYSHLLRGYALSSFLVLLQAWLLAAALLRGRRAALLAFPFAAALGALALPVNLFFTAGLGLWAAWISRRRGDKRLLAMLAVSGAAGAGLALACYLPVLADLRRQAAPTAGGFAALAAERLKEFWLAFGSNGFSRLFWLAAAAAGTALLWRRRREAAVLVLAAAGGPLLAAFALGNVPPARVYVALLPFTALAAGRLLRELVPLRSKPWAAAVLAAAAAAAGLDAWSFLRYNAGLDLRGAMIKARELTRGVDDYVIVAAPLREDETAGALNWDYYGFAANIEPYAYLAQGADFPYLQRSDYLFLALSKEGAAAAAERSGLDDHLVGRLQEAGRAGRVGVYRTGLDDEALRRYSAEANGPGPSTAALSALGWRAYKSAGDLKTFVGLMSRARELEPENPKVRYLLGLGAYLAFQDEAAAQELSWVVEHDTQNVHAPYYLAEALAGQGKVKEALRWYSWYYEPGRPAGSWVLKHRAGIGRLFAAAHGGKIPYETSSPEAWERMGRRYEDRGAYERARVAMTNAFNGRKSVDRWLKIARYHAMEHDYVQAAKMIALLIQQGTPRPELKYYLAKELSLKGENERALALVEEFLAVQPDHKDSLELLTELRRAP